MALDKREKIKFYVVIGLALIFVATAYYRFWHKKDSTAPDRHAAATSLTEPTVTRIAIDAQADSQDYDGSKEVILPVVKRDIFRPVDRPTVVVSRPPKKSQPNQSRSRFRISNSAVRLSAEENPWPLSMIASFAPGTPSPRLKWRASKPVPFFWFRETKISN